MSELNVMALGITLRAVTVMCITAGVVYLAANDKPGWGWLIVLGILVSCKGYRYTKD